MRSPRWRPGLTAATQPLSRLIALAEQQQRLQASDAGDTALVSGIPDLQARICSGVLQALGAEELNEAEVTEALETITPYLRPSLTR